MKKIILLVAAMAFVSFPAMADPTFPNPPTKGGDKSCPKTEIACGENDQDSQPRGGDNFGGKDGIIIYPGETCFPAPFDYICWIG